MPKDWEDVKPSLDKLIADKPEPSPPVKVKIGKHIVTVAFRMLSQRRCVWIQLEARKWVIDEMAAYELPKDDINSGVMLDLYTGELDIRLLQAACINPEDGSIAFSVDKLRAEITPLQRDALFKLWAAWQAKFTPEVFTEEEIKALIESVKKKGMSDDLLVRFGTDGLLTCISILVAELETLKTAKSSDGGGKDAESSETASSSSSPSETSSQSLSTKCWDSLVELEAEVEELKKQLDTQRIDWDTYTKWIKEIRTTMNLDTRLPLD